VVVDLHSCRTMSGIFDPLDGEVKPAGPQRARGRGASLRAALELDSELVEEALVLRDLSIDLVHLGP
jgi:hypothetical protein